MALQPAEPHEPSAPAPIDRRAAVVGLVMLAFLAMLAVGLVVLVLRDNAGGIGGTAGATPGPSSFAYADVGPAPALELKDQDGNPFSLASLRGQPVMVFFGYTHCPDVCPATIGNVNQVLLTTGEGPRAVFVSIDPERDDVAAMNQYLRYLPKAYVGLSGTPADIRRTADAWGVKYARIDTGAASGYAMAHTADVFLVDAQGMLRAHFPFGTKAEPIAAAVEALMAETPAGTAGPGTATLPTAAPGTATPEPTPGTATPEPTPGATTPASVAGGLTPLLISSSIWAGGASPVILRITDAMGAGLDGSVPIRVRLVGPDGAAASPEVAATAVRPEGSKTVSFVPVLDIPTPGPWRLDVLAADGRSGSAQIQALDPGSTAPLGKPAPAVDTPTLADVGGVVRAVTTQPAPDLRFSQTSTADSLAAGKPYVLVVDSSQFRVSPACGRALMMTRYLLDRWPDVTFIHLEPFVYQVITEEPVLSGPITDPPLNQYSRAFGIGPAPWPAVSMPWIFVVDGQGIMRAKYTGIIGSADVDVIVSLITGNGVIGS
ncbi:MAG TPA: SCO family protein [Candidatus Limnocylindrales bacterium]